MNDSKTKTIVNALSILITPSGSAQSTGKIDMFEVLSRNVEKVEEYIESNNLKLEEHSIDKLSVDVKKMKLNTGDLDRFLNISQKLLISLKEDLLQVDSLTPDSQTDILSVQQQKIVFTAVELFVSFGIIPNLIDGIGIPISKRSNFANVIKSIATSSSFCYERYLTLRQCTCTLLHCKEHREFSQVVHRHTSDVLASLLQLSHSPLSTLCISENKLTESMKQEFLNDKKEMCVKLRTFLSELQPSINIKEILVLQECNSVNTPVWFRKVCNKYLSQEFIQKNGVTSLISAVLCNDLENDKDGNFNWQKCDVVGKIVVGCRLPNQSPDEYFGHVFPQILELLHVQAKQQRICIPVAVNIFVKASEQFPEFADKYLWAPLLQPLLDCSEEKICDLDSDYVNEEKLSQCIDDLCQLFILGTHLSEAMYDKLTSVVGIIFHLYTFNKSEVSNVRSQLLSLLIAYLKHHNERGKIAFFKNILFDISDDSYLVLPWNINLEVDVGINSGFCVKRKIESEEFMWINDVDKITEAVMEILHLLQNENFISPFFLMLMQEFTLMQTKLDDLKECKRNSSDQKLLIEIEETVTHEQKVFKNSFIVIQLFESMSENSKFQDLMMNDKISCFKLLKTMFSRAAGKRSDEEFLQTETLTIAVTLTLILISKKLTPEEKKHLEKLLPDLQTLSDHHSSQGVKNMANELRCAILTNGVIMPSGKNSCDSNKTEYQTLLDELYDPMIPIRGHALIGLRKLIMKRDSETLLHADELLEIFQKNLDHDDSYIYLAAVQGLASLTDRFPDKVVSRLTTEFANFDTSKSSSVELRLKLGEVILKVTQMLGEMLPKYRDLLLRAFLYGCKDENSHVRASSLSNLGEVCKGLKFAVEPCIHEILFCIQSLLKTDSTTEVKEACLLVITLLLRGLGSDVFQVLKSNLKELYGLLKTIYAIERNDRIKLHAQLALDELTVIIKSFFNPEQKFEKRIYVLDAP